MLPRSSFAACPWPALPAPRGVPLTVLPEHACSYLPDRLARNRGFICRKVPPELYHALMDAGFRRSGTFFYQPICAGCRQCRQIRVPVSEFAMSRSQRRVWRRNQDLRVYVDVLTATDEKFDLYMRYLRARHDPQREESRQNFEEFLYQSPVQTMEICYRDASGKLVGVGICDVCTGRSLSSVYFYFDPSESDRSPGTFSSLWEIAAARRFGIPYYYIGYFIRGCPAMNYKAQFHPHELLEPDGSWQQISGPRALKCENESA